MNIQDKARAALAARDAHDNRWTFMLAMLSAVTGLPEQVCEQKIEELAK